MNKKYKKLFSIFPLITLYPLSFFFRRNPNLWVFGCYHNLFADNSKYQFLWTTQNAKEIKCIWISGSRAIVNQLRLNGYNAHLRWSWKGLTSCLSAGKYIYCSYLADINFFTSGNAKRVNLWHGVGLKKIEFKIQEGQLKKKFSTSILNPYRLLVPEQFARPDLFLSTSPLMTEHFSECFRIDSSKCFEGTYPRLELHKDPSLMKQAKQFGNYEEIKKKLTQFNKRWVYMPTWRDSQSGVTKAIPSIPDLNKALQSVNSILVIKIHTNEEPKLGNNTSNILFWDNALDIYPMLNEFDGLITDYSSILYDFLALNKTEVILYNYDFEEYKLRSREFAYPYKENTTGEWANNFQQLCQLLSHPEPIKSAYDPTIKVRFWNSKHSEIKDIHSAINNLTNTPQM